MTTFTVDLGNGRSAIRTSKTRTYTHVVVDDVQALSWHQSERTARDAQLSRRRFLIGRSFKADGIAVVPCQPVEVAARKQAVAAMRKGQSQDATHIKRLLGRAVSDVAHYARSIERSQALIADLEADERAMRNLPSYASGALAYAELEVVLLPRTHARAAGAGEYVLASQRDYHLTNARVGLGYSTTRHANAAKRQARLERQLARLEQASA